MKAKNKATGSASAKAKAAAKGKAKAKAKNVPTAPTEGIDSPRSSKRPSLRETHASLMQAPEAQVGSRTATRTLWEPRWASGLTRRAQSKRGSSRKSGRCSSRRCQRASSSDAATKSRTLSTPPAELLMFLPTGQGATGDCVSSDAQTWLSHMGVFRGTGSCIKAEAKSSASRGSNTLGALQRV